MTLHLFEFYKLRVFGSHARGMLSAAIPPENLIPDTGLQTWPYSMLTALSMRFLIK